MSDSVVKDVLSRYRNVAVVGLSRDPSKDSYVVAKYLKSVGYKIIPVNPLADEILDEKCYPSLLDLPDELKATIEIVNIFRPSHEVDEIINQVIEIRRKFGRPYVVWMQLGIRNDEAAEKARRNGLIVIQDKCIKIEHSKLQKRQVHLEDSYRI